MEANQYQRLALVTAAPPGDSQSLHLAILGLGIAGEAGEVADLLKKVIGHGHSLDPEWLAKELGDVLWYVATIAAQVGLPLSTVMERNIEKLAKRYPGGFSEEKSRNREPER